MHGKSISLTQIHNPHEIIKKMQCNPINVNKNTRLEKTITIIKNIVNEKA